MKHTRRILTLFLFLLFFGALSLHAMAADAVTAEASSEVSLVGDTLTVTVSLDEITASSLGVAVTCDPSLTVIEGNWLKDGLIASYDMTKHKGVYTAGGASKVSGKIFALTLRADSATSEEVSVSVTVIAKNGAATVLEETVTSTLRITCRAHNFSLWQIDGASHTRICSVCGKTETEEHSFDLGTVTAPPTCEEPGERTFSCSVCQQHKTELIPPTKHCPILVGVKLPTCQQSGYSGDTICSLCQTRLTVGTSLDQTPHLYEHGVCLTCGVKDPSIPPASSEEDEPISPPVSSEKDEPLSPPDSAREDDPIITTPTEEPSETAPTTTPAPEEAPTTSAPVSAPATADRAIGQHPLLWLLPLAAATLLVTVLGKKSRGAK